MLEEYGISVKDPENFEEVKEKIKEVSGRLDYNEEQRIIYRFI